MKFQRTTVLATLLLLGSSFGTSEANHGFAGFGGESVFLGGGPDLSGLNQTLVGPLPDKNINDDLSYCSK